MSFSILIKVSINISFIIDLRTKTSCSIEPVRNFELLLKMYDPKVWKMICFIKRSCKL